MLNSRDTDRLRPDVATACRKVISLSKDKGIDIMITSTVRDDEYQAQLYAQGRTMSGPIVTNAKQPTFHWDKAGLAFDFCPVDEKGACLWHRTDLFNAVGAIGKSLGLEWGGDWKSITDLPHLQWSGYNHELTGGDIRAGKCPPELIIKEDKPMERQEAIDILFEKGIINSKDYWLKVCDTLIHFDALIKNMAEKVK